MTIRMNEALRERLNKEVTQLVHLPELGRAEMEAYNNAAPLVREAVEKKYPQKDMKICAKYEAASVDDCIKLQLTAGGVQEFRFIEKTGPLVVKKTYSGQVYLADDPTTTAVLDWVEAHETHDKQLRALRNDYHALIQSAKTLEEVLEIWPEVAGVELYARSNALTILSADVIARIRADVATRAAT